MVSNKLLRERNFVTKFCVVKTGHAEVFSIFKSLNGYKKFTRARLGDGMRLVDKMGIDDRQRKKVIITELIAASIASHHEWHLAILT
jgi:hypothetical protein